MRKALILFSVLAFFLCACGDSAAHIHAQTNNAAELSMTCSRFTGTRQTSLVVADGSSTTLYGSISHTGGTCDIHIFQESGDVIYSSDQISSNTSFRLILQGANTYYISIDCNHYSGSYSFTWDFTGSGATVAIPDKLVVPDENEQSASTQPSISASIDQIELWDGQFYCEELDATALLHRIDDDFCQIKILYQDSILVAIAQINPLVPYEASYAESDGFSFVFYRSGSLLEITQSSTGADCNLSGNYLSAPVK